MIEVLLLIVEAVIAVLEMLWHLIVLLANTALELSALIPGKAPNAPPGPNPPP